MNEETEIPSEPSTEKKRTRKKQLYSSIKNLMEFYFSPANLGKDRWLNRKLKECDSISLSHFLNFNKLRALTNNVNDIVKALKNSELLEVNEDCEVKLLLPVQFKENQDDCIIYIEQIPPDADHDWIRSFFSCYGPIDYISIPRYTNSKKCKGFAFIEFSNVESATKAIEEYKKAGHYLSNSIEPQELLSISTFEKKNQQPINLPIEINPDQVEAQLDIMNSKKRKLTEEENPVTVEYIDKKKIKLDDEEECTDDLHLQRHLVQTSNAEDLNSEECSEGIEGNADESKKKKNRKKKKKTKKNKVTPEATGFQILSKKDWKSLRNKYLNIQKEKMKQLKKHLRQTQAKSDYYKHFTKTKEIDEKSNNEINTNPVSKDYIPGVIVKIELSEPIVNLKEFKAEVNIKNDEVKYIDVKEGSFCAYVRLASPESASDFCEKSVWNHAEILKDDEELEYWDKLEKDRQSKLSAPPKKMKKRGREKMLKKAEKILGKHITFDDE